MKNRIAVFMVVIVVLVMALSACGVVDDLSTVNDLGKSFMTAFRDSDPASSWAMMTPALQTELGDASAWANMIAPYNFSEWSFSNTQVENNTAQMDGEAALDADTYTVQLVFEKVNDAWLISGFDIALK